MRERVTRRREKTDDYKRTETHERNRETNLGKKYIEKLTTSAGR